MKKLLLAAILGVSQQALAGNSSGFPGFAFAPQALVFRAPTREAKKPGIRPSGSPSQDHKREARGGVHGKK